MNTFKWMASAALVVTAGLAAGAAHARDADVQWSVTIGSPGYPVYTQPYPVYREPVPVYRHAVPVYRPPVVVLPYPRHAARNRWDSDGDGIPNHRDRLYNPVWDRDGDGVPNRYDRDDRYDGYGRHDRDHDRRDGGGRYDEGWRR